MFSIGLVAHACAASSAGVCGSAAGTTVFGTAEHGEYSDARYSELDRADPSHALASARFGPAVNRLVARMLRVSPSARIGFSEALAEVERLIASPMRVRVSDANASAMHNVYFGTPLLGDLRLRASIAMRYPQRSLAIFYRGAHLSRDRDGETLTSLGIGPTSTVSVDLYLGMKSSTAKDIVESDLERFRVEVAELYPPGNQVVHTADRGEVSVSDAVSAFMAAQSSESSSVAGSRSSSRGTTPTSASRAAVDSNLCDDIVALVRRAADTEGKIPFSTIFSSSSGLTKPVWICGPATLFFRNNEPYRSRLLVSAPNVNGQVSFCVMFR